MITEVTTTLLANKIDVLIVDPFVSCHHVTENDNNAIDRVAKTWSHIAQVTNCSIMLAHHTRKTVNGSNVSVDDGRGASALLNAARPARTLNKMTEQEAEKARVDVNRKGFYFRADLGKTNLTRPAESAEWYQLISFDLKNGPMPGLPGDEVGVVVPWEYP